MKNITMDMTVVLGIFTFFFFLSLFIMCYYRSKINVKVWNTVFIIADFIAYSCWNYASYQKGWLRDGWMTLGNISPLMFTIILLTPFMNEKIRDYAFSALAFLNVGMFFAMLISPEHDYIFNFNTEATFVYTSEAVCHMLCSLYGIYLVLSKQVKADFKHWIKSVVFTLSIITFGVILNFVYHLRNFGMDPYGHAQIYMLDLFGGFWATLVAYYFGVVLVLTVGYQGVSMLERFLNRLGHESEDPVLLADWEAPDKDVDPAVNAGEEKHYSIDPDEPDDLEEISISVNRTDECIAAGSDGASDAQECPCEINQTEV